MNFEDNSISSKIMESDRIKELYKKTPLKKRPIQPCSLSPDEKKISPKPRAVKSATDDWVANVGVYAAYQYADEVGKKTVKECTVPEGRLSKRKMLKPTKKLIDSYVESTKVLEQAPKAMYVPVIKTSAEAKDTFPVEVNKKVVNMAMAMAIPELKKTTGEETEVPSRFPKSSKAFCKKNFTQQELEDFQLAIELQKKEFNLRERQPRRSSTNSNSKTKFERSPIKAEEDSEESMDIFSISSLEMSKEADGKQMKQEIKRIPNSPPVNIGEDENDPFSGSHSHTMYALSPALANVVGHKKMTSSAIIDAMHYVFLERNLIESNKKIVNCDAELTGIFRKRRLRLDELRRLLLDHITLDK